MKEELLIQILEITEKQQQALEEENIDLFKSLLGNRQTLMDKIDKLNKQYKQETNVKEKKTLEQIIKIDTLNHQEFNRQYSQVKDKLKQTRQMKKRDDMYASNYSYGTYIEEGIFFDKKNR